MTPTESITRAERLAEKLLRGGHEFESFEEEVLAGQALRALLSLLQKLQEALIEFAGTELNATAVHDAQLKARELIKSFPTELKPTQS